MQAIAANNIAPERLELEITESVLMSDTEFTLQRLHQIKKIGVRIALDDFGTGLSSLSCLHKLPFDVLKIDRSFVSRLDSDPDQRNVVAAIILMAERLNLDTLAVVVDGVGYRNWFLLRSRLSPNLSWRFKWTTDHQLARTYVVIRNFGALTGPEPDATNARGDHTAYRFQLDYSF